jgi:hypothetical protein
MTGYRIYFSMSCQIFGRLESERLLSGGGAQGFIEAHAGPFARSALARLGIAEHLPRREPGQPDAAPPQ